MVVIIKRSSFRGLLFSFHGRFVFRGEFQVLRTTGLLDCYSEEPRGGSVSTWILQGTRIVLAATKLTLIRNFSLYGTWKNSFINFTLHDGPLTIYLWIFFYGLNLVLVSCCKLQVEIWRSNWKLYLQKCFCMKASLITKSVFKCYSLCYLVIDKNALTFFVLLRSS